MSRGKLETVAHAQCHPDNQIDFDFCTVCRLGTDVLESAVSWIREKKTEGERKKKKHTIITEIFSCHTYLWWESRSRCLNKTDLLWKTDVQLGPQSHLFPLLLLFSIFLVILFVVRLQSGHTVAAVVLPMFVDVGPPDIVLAPVG